MPTDIMDPLADEVVLTYADLAKRWKCSESRLRNAHPTDLPARLDLPKSRLVRFPLSEVIAFEGAHTEARDYAAEIRYGLPSVSDRLSFGRRPAATRR